jgi:hypothetical protein
LHKDEISAQMDFRLIIVLAVLFPICLSSQVTFNKANEIYRQDVVHNGGMAGGCIDLNGDYYDDVIALNRSRLLEVGLNQGPNKKLNWKSRVSVSTTEEYSIVAGDINNDGVCEIISSGLYNGGKVYSLNFNGLYQLKSRLQPFVYAQGANLADINNDGYLDFFLCNDEGDNLTFLNDRSGNLVSAPGLINYTTVPASDNSGNYGSEWCDIDNDGDLDLYIAKCKFGISNIEDPRRHNMLFINTNGRFTNEAEKRGLKDKGQSWTGSFGDYDNDGDLDCIVTNHDTSHKLYENDGKGFFTPSKANIALSQSYAFQSIWADYDNNGWIDLLLTGADVTEIHFNIDGKKFNKVTSMFNNQVMNSASIGDINNDGFYDVVAVYGKDINLPSTFQDMIWTNSRNNNNFIKLLFNGGKSNRMGVGSKITLYTKNGIQYREVQAGVAYGISNSNNIIFGLGEQNNIDSLIVRWPSGQVNKIINPKVNESYLINEGSCVSQRLKIDAAKTILCPNELLDLKVNGIGNNIKSIKWSNGDTTSILKVFTAGNYSATITTNDNCQVVTELLSINTPPSSKLIQQGRDTVYFCSESQLSVYPYFRQPKWSNGATTNSILIKNTGSYSVSALDVCNMTVEEKIFASKVDEVKDKIETKNDTVLRGGNAIIRGIGKNIIWINKDNDIVGYGDSIVFRNVQSSFTISAASGKRSGIKSYGIGEKNIPVINTNAFASNTIDFGLTMQVYKPTYIKSCEVATDRDGVRRVIVNDEKNNTIYQKDFFIRAGNKQVLPLDIILLPGSNYVIKTDTNINISNLGYKSPRLARIQESTGYPFEEKSLLEISSNNRGGPGYYYFFNFVIEDEGTLCLSEYTQANVVMNTSNILEEESIAINISPNPTSSQINLDVEHNGKLQLINNVGSVIFSSELEVGSNILNLGHLTNGLYIASILIDNKIYQRKIIISK